MSQERVALVTGASRGIGREVARLLAGNGLVVFGTSRTPSKVGPLDGVEMLSLEARSDDSAAACIDAVVSRAGRIDALINNAGYALSGPVEAATLEEAKDQFETNFWGVVRMVNAVLPGMRERKAGRIINLSSLAGLVPIPFFGFYSASKFALEGYSEALHHELRPLGIQVSLIEPGFLRTSLTREANFPQSRLRAYEPWQGKALSAVERYVSAAPDASLAAEAVWRILEAKSPRLRYRVGKEAMRTYGLRRFAPESMFEKGLRRNFDL